MDDDEVSTEVTPRSGFPLKKQRVAFPKLDIFSAFSIKIDHFSKHRKKMFLAKSAYCRGF
jgi:hypothetical protein